MKRTLISMAVMAALAASAAAAPKGNGGGQSGGSKGGNGGGSNGMVRSLNLNKPLNQTKPLVHNLGGINQGNGNGNQVKNLKVNGAGLKEIKTPLVSQEQKNLHIDLNKHQNWHGARFNFGWCFRGFQHNHWDHRCWLPGHGCYGHWCAVSCCYYYWCVPDGCWYPISYCPYGKFCW